MARWERVISAVGPLRILTGLGGLFVVLGAGRSVLFWRAGVPILWTLDGLVMTSAAGIALLYGRYWLPRSDLPPDQYPRIAAWTLVGLEVMVIVFGLIAINPFAGISRPFFTPLIGTGIGSLAGFMVGVYNAQAVTQASESEARRDQFLSERALRERLVETSAIGMLVVDADGSIGLANERAAEILGRSRESLLGMKYPELPFAETDPSDKSDEMDVYQRVLSTGDAVHDEDRQVVTSDGQPRYVSVHAAPLRAASGEHVGVVFALEDVTERKALEAELQETVSRLEESNERLEQFASVASHDLREPLRMITNYLQLLEERYGDELDEDGEEFIDHAVDGANRMRAMVDSLLEYSRVSTSRAPQEPVDANLVLEDVRRDLQGQIEETGATVTADELPTIFADGDQLAQVLRNLISNALKYSGDEAPEVHVSADRTDGEWRFAVADRGVGIDPADQDRIFEVFETLHTDAEGAGSGIGLAICQRIIERHDGEIWVESEPGEGTKVYFTIPLSDERQSARNAESPSSTDHPDAESSPSDD